MTEPAQDPIDPAVYAPLAATIRPGAEVRRAWTLHGGVSAVVHAVEIAHPDGTAERLVVRRHGQIDKSHNPDIAAHEYRLLNVLHVGGLPVPTPVAVDTDGSLLGGSGLVIAFVEGTSVQDLDAGKVRTMARLLARIHAHPIDGGTLAFLPRRTDPAAGTLDRLPSGERGQRVAAAFDHQAPTSASPTTLLHGDFWPNNLLWRDGEIAAVLDWEDAAIGDPLSDLAGARLELLWTPDAHAMTAFTEAYLGERPLDLTDLPLWELHVASAAWTFMDRWGMSPGEEARKRCLTEAFIDDALDRLETRRTR